jgi:hypothetical protein
VGGGGPERREESEEGDEDDDQAGDEGGFGGRGAREAGGLELVSGREKDANDQAGEDRATREIAEVAMVDDGQRKEGKRHSDEVEKKGRDVPERVLDEREGGSPDGYHGEEQKVGEGAGV